MEEITNRNYNDTDFQEDEPKASPSFGKGNFKTFTLLRQQENLISQFESNLQKTLELLNNKSPTQSVDVSMQEGEKGRSITFENNDFMKSSRVEQPQNFFDKENYALKLEIKDLKRENEMLKVNLNSMTANKNTEERQRVEPLQREIEELRKKLSDANSENDTLRAEIIKVKTDSFKKYEQLQKNNDELLVSYEERV
jgi:predicted RNase H-like nuclease (RuvC/YqgF family)